MKRDDVALREQQPEARGVGRFRPRRRSVRMALLLASASPAALLLQMGLAQAQAMIDGGSTVTVPGTHSSPWNVGGNLAVGDTGVGTLTIMGSGSVSNFAGDIGRNLNSSGTVTVTGPGSTWTNSSSLNVGFAGSGTLTIENGGSVSNAGSIIGVNSTSTGTVTVTGSGSTCNSGDLTVGLTGAGSLTIADGGVVTAAAMLIGGNAAGRGTLTLAGTVGARGMLTTNQIAKGSGSATLNLDGGVLRANGSQSNFLSNFAPGDVVIGAGGAFIDSNGSAIGIAAPLGGTGSLTKQGTGILTLSGANTYTGDTIVEAGILRTGAANAFASAGTTTIAAGATLDLAGFNQSVGALAGAGDVALGAGILTTGGNNASTMFSGTIGGTGSLTKLGTGTLTLSGASTYSGGTTIRDGAIEIRNVNALGSGNVILTGGHLRSNIAGTATLSNPIIIRAGDPVRTISAATSQTLNINFNFVGNNAILKFGTASDTGTVSVGGTVSGGYGIYWIEAVGGTLRAGSPALSTLLSGGAQALTIHENATVDMTTYDSTFFDLRGKGTLTGNGATFTISEGIFDGTISGNTSLKKVTPVTLTLNGRNTLTGPTQVLNGLLVVNGSLASSPVSVSVDANGKGILGGTGTVGNLSVLAGGTVAPGNSIGTLTVNGNVAFANGSFYALEIDKAGRSDRIAATGAATLSGGTVQILPDQGTGYVENKPYTILTARNGVTGTFAGTSGGNFAFVTPTLGYSGDTATLTLVRKTDPTDPDKPTPMAFHTVAETINQYRTADAVESLGTGNRLYSTVLGSSVGTARQAFDALSGEAHASAMGVAYQDGRLVREAILTRLRQPVGSSLPILAQGSYNTAYAADLPGAAPRTVAIPGPSLDPRRFALWGEGFGSWGKVESNGNAASLDTSTGGFILGADAELDSTWRLGLAGGFTRTSFDIDGRLSSGSNESIFGALYGAGSWGAFNLRMGAAYAWHDVDIQRRVQFPGFADATDASYDGWSAQAFAELGYRFDLAGVQLEPFVGASVLRLHTDAFHEEGGAAALTRLGQDQDLAITTLGLRAQARLSADVPLSIRGMLGWRHAFGDVEPTALLAFAGSASAFAVAGIPVDRDALAVEAGLDWQASDALSLGVSYSGQIGERAQDHSLKGNLIWRFATH